MWIEILVDLIIEVVLSDLCKQYKKQVKVNDWAPVRPISKAMRYAAFANSRNSVIAALIPR